MQAIFFPCIYFILKNFSCLFRFTFFSSKKKNKVKKQTLHVTKRSRAQVKIVSCVFFCNENQPWNLELIYLYVYCSKLQFNCRSGNSHGEILIKQLAVATATTSIQTNFTKISMEFLFLISILFLFYFIFLQFQVVF